MPRDHPALPHGRLIEIDDSYALLPEDQPRAPAEAIHEFAREAAPPAANTQGMRA